MRAEVRSAEDAGFDVVHAPDHVGDAWAPLALLLAMAEATTRIRVGTLVLNNDFHHPVHLAREIAAIDRLSGHRRRLSKPRAHLDVPRLRCAATAV